MYHSAKFLRPDLHGYRDIGGKRGRLFDQLDRCRVLVLKDDGQRIAGRIAGTHIGRKDGAKYILLLPEIDGILTHDLRHGHPFSGVDIAIDLPQPVVLQRAIDASGCRQGRVGLRSEGFQIDPRKGQGLHMQSFDPSLPHADAPAAILVLARGHGRPRPIIRVGRQIKAKDNPTAWWQIPNTKGGPPGSRLGAKIGMGRPLGENTTRSTGPFPLAPR